MAIELKVPVLPESVSDATIAGWHKKAGDTVRRDENLVDLETDKVVLEVPSPVDGVLKEIKHGEGDTVTSEQILALIEEGAVASDDSAEEPAEQDKTASDNDDGKSTSDKQAKPGDDAKPEKKVEAKSTKPPAKSSSKANEDLSPAGRRVATEQGIDASKVEGTGRGGRVTKEDLLKRNQQITASPGNRPEERVPMTRIRKRIAERLMQSKNSIAMLTSFNEINLAEVKQMRKSFGEQFKAEYGVKLGYMSFFVKAACEALKRHPTVNASVDGEDIIYHGYQDISIAVSTDRGLVTPVVRDAQDMSFAEIEAVIGDYADRARAGKLTLDDLQGGTFTVTNGGTFGSLLSTPIVNPPQSAILGMHTIKDRADVVNGELGPPHHRRQGCCAVPGRHQEPTGKSAQNAARPVRPMSGLGTRDPGLGRAQTADPGYSEERSFSESRVPSPESRIKDSQHHVRFKIRCHRHRRRPGRLCGRDPRCTAGPEDGLHRQFRGPGRQGRAGWHVSQCRLYPFEGTAGLLAPVRQCGQPL